MVKLLFSRWRRNILNFPALIRHALEAFGALWLVVEASSNFSDDLARYFKGQWALFLALGLLIAAWRSLPRIVYSAKMAGRDCLVSIYIGDILTSNEDLVVPSNTTFDTSMNDGIISPKSVQGQFTLSNKMTPEVIDMHLERDLSAIAKEEIVSLRGQKGKGRRYPIGTVAKVAYENRAAYFLALCHMNSSGTAEGSPEYIAAALPKLWNHIATKGRKGVIAVPLIGTGFSRTDASRQRVFQEILRSFIAASARRTFCDELRIYIFPSDIDNFSIDVDQLAGFMEFECKYGSPIVDSSGGLADFSRVQIDEGGIVRQRMGPPENRHTETREK